MIEPRYCMVRCNPNIVVSIDSNYIFNIREIILPQIVGIYDYSCYCRNNLTNRIENID